MFKKEEGVAMEKNKMEQNIDRQFRQWSKAEPHPAVFERTWVKIEDRLADRKPKTHLVWRPWSHPVRWVAIAACMCLTLIGYLYQGNLKDSNDIASHLMSVSNPTASMTRDQNFIKISALLTDSPSSAPEMSDEVKVDALASDEIFL
jgi:negative regulator of sigma E activity